MSLRVVPEVIQRKRLSFGELALVTVAWIATSTTRQASLVLALLSVVTKPTKQNCERHKPLFKLQSGFGHKADPTRFTTLAKRTVEDAAALLEETCSQQVLFATLTLPGQRPQTKRVLADWSSWLVQKLKAWLHYHAPSALTVGVWERQKGGALHLHLACGSRDEADLQTIEQLLVSRWLQLLTVLSQKTGVNLFVNAHGVDYSDKHHLLRNEVERVKKSVKKYLSKYVSKQGSKNIGATGNGGTFLGNYFPTRWWFIDEKLRKQIKQARTKVQSEVWQFAVAQNIYEQLTGGVVEFAAKSFAYENPVFAADRHLVLVHNDAHSCAFAQAAAYATILYFPLKFSTDLVEPSGEELVLRSQPDPAPGETTPQSSREIFGRFMVHPRLERLPDMPIL